jgi:K+-transporting ATPase KdpF subunit
MHGWFWEQSYFLSSQSHIPMRATSSDERRMNTENIVMLIVSALLMVYLIYALLRPEKF